MHHLRDLVNSRFLQKQSDEAPLSGTASPRYVKSEPVGSRKKIESEHVASTEEHRTIQSANLSRDFKSYGIGEMIKNPRAEEPAIPATA